MPFWFTASTLMTLGMVNLRCSPSSIPARPTIGNVAGVSGLTGKPVVICSRTAACARCRGAAPNASPRIKWHVPRGGPRQKGHQRLRHCRQHAALPHDPGECSLALQLQIRIVGPLARISHMWPDEAAGSKCIAAIGCLAREPIHRLSWPARYQRPSGVSSLLARPAQKKRTYRTKVDVNPPIMRRSRTRGIPPKWYFPQVAHICVN